MNPNPFTTRKSRSAFFLTALLTAFLVGACSHREKAPEPRVTADRSISSVSSPAPENPPLRMQDTRRAVKPQLRQARATEVRANPVAAPEPARDIASVPANTAASTPAEHRWLPWMTIALGILLAIALVASVRTIRNGPRP